jgi:hypothetical protein
LSKFDEKYKPTNQEPQQMPRNLEKSTLRHTITKLSTIRNKQT